MRPVRLSARGGQRLAVLASALLSCAAPGAPEMRGPRMASLTETGMRREPAQPTPALPPLVSDPLVSLPVKGHRDAVVSVPVGATTPRPVIVAAHGAGDRPDSQCRYWRAMVKDGAFVLCPRGFPTNPYVPEQATGFFYTTHYQLGDEITAALAALADRFPVHADLDSPLFAGFSQGAIMGALLLPQHAARFSRAVLIEGGYGLFQEWNRLVARSFKRRGGDRILLVCGRPECTAKAVESARYLSAEGVETRVVSADGAGHTYFGAVAGQVASALSWIVEDDSRFGPLDSAPELR